MLRGRPFSGQQEQQAVRDVGQAGVADDAVAHVIPRETPDRLRHGAAVVDEHRRRRNVADVGQIAVGPPVGGREVREAVNEMLY